MSGGGEEPGAGGLVLLFESTHAALAAEERILEEGLWCDVVPRPPGTSTSLCGLAIAIRDENREDIADLLRKAGIGFETYGVKGPDESG
jgi:hypothetical protein